MMGYFVCICFNVVFGGLEEDPTGHDGNTDAVCNDEKLYMNASTVLLQNCQPKLQEHHYVLNRGFHPS
jgi:hypothetical protein